MSLFLNYFYLGYLCGFKKQQKTKPHNFILVCFDHLDFMTSSKISLPSLLGFISATRTIGGIPGCCLQYCCFFHLKKSKGCMNFRCASKVNQSHKRFPVVAPCMTTSHASQNTRQICDEKS